MRISLGPLHMFGGPKPAELMGNGREIGKRRRAMRRMDYVPHSLMHIILSHESPEDSLKWTAGHGRCGSAGQFAANGQGSPSTSCHPILPPPARCGSLSVFVARQMQGYCSSLPHFFLAALSSLWLASRQWKLMALFPSALGYLMGTWNGLTSACAVQKKYQKGVRR